MHKRVGCPVKRERQTRKREKEREPTLHAHAYHRHLQRGGIPLLERETQFFIDNLLV